MRLLCVIVYQSPSPAPSTGYLRVAAVCLGHEGRPEGLESIIDLWPRVEPILHAATRNNHLSSSKKAISERFQGLEARGIEKVNLTAFHGSLVKLAMNKHERRCTSPNDQLKLKVLKEQDSSCPNVCEQACITLASTKYSILKFHAANGANRSCFSKVSSRHGAKSADSYVPCMRFDIKVDNGARSRMQTSHSRDSIGASSQKNFFQWNCTERVVQRPWWSSPPPVT